MANDFRRRAGSVRRNKFGVVEPGDHWTYHAVANVIRGVSLLSARPEVDANRIGITGISWGGYLTCIVSGLDDRLKVSVPVYGCGFLEENSVWLGRFAAMTPERRVEWTKLWDPSRYVGQAAMPVLFMNGTNDFAYPLDSYRKTYRLVKNRDICVTVNMPHGHSQGWHRRRSGCLWITHQWRSAAGPREELPARGGVGGARIREPLACEIGRAALHNRHGSLATAQVDDRFGETRSGAGDCGNPATRPLVHFMTLVDERDAVVSGEHDVLE